MKLLFFQWNAFMQKDIERILKNIPEICVDTVSYEFRDVNHDDFFITEFPAYLLKEKYDLVFSVNFFPLVSDICEQYNIRYISWIYDAPMNIRKISSIANHVNTLYVFDRGQYTDLCSRGFSTVKHLPLGVDTQKISSMEISEADHIRFDSSISFVGRLYSSDFDELMVPLPHELQARISNLVNSQMFNYGEYFLNKELTSDFMGELNHAYLKASSGSFQVLPEEFEFLLASEITRRERLAALTALSKKHEIFLYSNESSSLSNVHNKGLVKYYSEMPKVFACSKINLNVTLKIIKTGMPLRILDILGAGGFLMSNYQAELADNYSDGKDIVMYGNLTELCDKCNYYLCHEDERKQIAINGHNKTHKLFELQKMLQKILLQPTTA